MYALREKDAEEKNINFFITTSFRIQLVWLSIF